MFTLYLKSVENYLNNLKSWKSIFDQLYWITYQSFLSVTIDILYFTIASTSLHIWMLHFLWYSSSINLHSIQLRQSYINKTIEYSLCTRYHDIQMTTFRLKRIRPHKKIHEIKVLTYNKRELPLLLDKNQTFWKTVTVIYRILMLR